MDAVPSLWWLGCVQYDLEKSLIERRCPRILHSVYADLVIGDEQNSIDIGFTFLKEISPPPHRS